MVKIDKLINFSNKSFKNYTNSNDLLFREKNIIFGYNGKGKSTLGIGLKQEFLNDKSKNDNNLRFFNKEYINRSLLLENISGKIKGVEANFGEKNVEVENRIKKLKEDIISDIDINNLKSEIDKIKKETRKEIDSIHDRKKGKTNIQRKSSAEAIEKVIEHYNKDYTDAKKMEKDDDKLAKINGDDTIEKQIKQLEALSQLSFSEIPSSDIDEIKNIFKEKYGEDIEVPKYEIIKWIEEGIKIHKENDKCKFCGGKLDYQNVKTKLEKYNENKKYKAIEKIKAFEKQLQTFLKEVETIKNNSQIYIVTVGDTIGKDFQNIIDCKNDIDALILSMRSKIEKIENDVNFDFEKLKSISDTIITSISAIRAEKDKQLIELRKKQNSLETLVKGSIGLEIVNSQSIKNKRQEIMIKENDLKIKVDANKTKLQEIQNLEQQKSSTIDFANFVSQILSDINISLKIEVGTDNHNYIIKSLHENILLALNDISEGEKNLLALLFFYYELFNDSKQQNIKTEIELIIVDDPISSMDDSNKFYILELMKNLLNLRNQQIFILTHSWDDFCNLTYGKKAWEENSKYATFEVRKNDGQSELVKLKNIEKPYKYLFKEIYNFSQKQETSIATNCEVYHYPNIMRRVFEEWYSFKIGKDLNLTSDQQERLVNDFKLIEDKKKMKLGVLLKVCNILSHSINNSINSQEIFQSAKFLMSLIKDNDKLHFDNMKQ
jgi:wobble nucleotide-excising tRNase